MGKAHHVKGELIESQELVYLIQTLKDIADNKYYTLVNQREQFKRFGETFVQFFHLISLTAAEHKLISNNNPKVGIIVVTIEGSFLAAYNNKIIRKAINEKDKYEQVEFIAIGNKSLDTLRPFSPNIKLFTDIEVMGLYETAITVKDYLVDQVMKDLLGKIIICYAWPKDFETQKTQTLKLLPCEDLVSQQVQNISIIEKVIEESQPRDIIGYLTNLWLTNRLYEILTDAVIASAAAQSSFLEERVEKLKKEEKVVKLKYLKARKNDIDKGLRETFIARMVSLR